ncbi:MAG: hypothetical protein WEA59_02415 [Ferruginibacter sp.]
MKKFFAIAFIAASLVACNETEKTDTTAPVVDSTAPVVVDSTAPVVVDTTAPVVVDTTKK